MTTEISKIQQKIINILPDGYSWAHGWKYSCPYCPGCVEERWGVGEIPVEDSNWYREMLVYTVDRGERRSKIYHELPGHWGGIIVDQVFDLTDWLSIRGFRVMFPPKSKDSEIRKVCIYTHCGDVSVGRDENILRAFEKAILTLP